MIDELARLEMNKNNALMAGDLKTANECEQRILILERHIRISGSEANDEIE